MRIALILSILILSLIGCKDDPIVLPCEIAEEHPYNGGTVLADVDGEGFMGESVFHKNEDGSFDLYFSRFSFDQCYTSDLISIPSVELILNDTSYINLLEGVTYEIKEGRDPVVGNKIIEGVENWVYLRETNIDTTELRGDFRLIFIDAGSDPASSTGSVVFENGQFFSEWRE